MAQNLLPGLINVSLELRRRHHHHYHFWFLFMFGLQAHLNATFNCLMNKESSPRTMEMVVDVVVVVVHLVRVLWNEKSYKLHY